MTATNARKEKDYENDEQNTLLSSTGLNDPTGKAGRPIGQQTELRLR